MRCAPSRAAGSPRISWCRASTFTGMTARGRTEKPPGRLDAGAGRPLHAGAAMAAGDFYIICPDNDVTRDIDNRRILWGGPRTSSATARRLSRWHPDYADEFRRISDPGSAVSALTDSKEVL